MLLDAALGIPLAKAEQRFAGAFVDLQPTWQTRAESWGRVGDRWLLVGTEKETASACALTPPPKGDFVIASDIELLGQRGSLRVMLALDSETMPSVHLAPEAVWIETWNVRARRWQEPTEITKVDWPLGRTIAVRIEVTGSAVRVLLDGVETLLWPHARPDLGSSWGLETNELPALFADLRVTPLRTK